jgi:putative endopeptidase
MRFAPEIFMKKFLLISVAAVALGAAPLIAQTATAPAPMPVTASAAAKPVYGTWGVELGNRDTSVAPGDDFEKFASGSWLAKNEIPSDKGAIGSGNEVNDRVQEQLRSQLTSGPAGNKYGALYASFMDEARVEAVGMAPLKADLAKVSAIKTRTQFTRFMGGTDGGFGISLVDFGVGADTLDPTMNVL